MAATVGLLFIAFWIAVGFGILMADFRAYRRAGPLQARPVRVADLEDGMAAKLVGTLRLPEDALQAPVSGRACAGYEVRVARKKRFLWRDVGKEREAGGFYLDDGTGEVFVPLSKDASLQLITAARYTKNQRRRGPKPVRRLLRRWLQEEPAASYRCDEGALVEGQRVAVYGVFRRRPDQRPARVDDYRSRPLQFVAEPGEDRVYVSDLRESLG
ncbi:MAG: hypothetical protein AAGH15_13505 [Myxococcota bacterium]